MSLHCKHCSENICCCCLVTKSCPTLFHPMNCSTPGFPVLHCLQEFAQVHVHWVSDTIQPSHPLMMPSPPAHNLSQHQYFPMSWLSASGGQSIRASTSVLPMNIQGWLPLGWSDWLSTLWTSFNNSYVIIPVINARNTESRGRVTSETPSW